MGGMGYSALDPFVLVLDNSMSVHVPLLQFDSYISSKVGPTT